MIKLGEKGTVNSISVNGCTYFLDTDFRVWINYQERIKNLLERKLEPYMAMFVGEFPVPTNEVILALTEFANPKSEMPKSSGNSERLIDFELDADYIFASFYQVYGIDLTVDDLHWHKFLALLSSLPDDTKIVEIMKYRLYSGDNKEMLKLKDAWALPITYTEEEQAVIDEFNDYVGG